MKNPSLILMGAGGHAKACLDVIEQHGGFAIGGIVGLRAEVGREIFGYRVIASDDDLAQVKQKHDLALIAVGQIQSPDERMRLFALARDLGFGFPSIVAPTAYVSRRASVGAGTVVMHGAIINAGARIGENCIINSRALVEHDAVVGDHCHISTGAILNGNVTVEAGSFVGSGSVLREGITLGPRCFVGMGSWVVRDQVGGSRSVKSIP